MDSATDAPPASEPRSQRRGLGPLLTFRAPELPEEEPATIPGPATSPEQLQPATTADLSSAPPVGSPSDDAWPLSEHDDSPHLGGTSSPGSSAEGSPLKLASKAALRATIASGVIVATETTNQLITRAESLERINGLYVANQVEADRFAEPAASFMSRHGGIAGGKINEDTKDALGMVVALAGYAGRQFALMRAIADHRAGERRGTEQPAVDVP